MAGAHQGQGRPARTVRPRHRRDADDPRGRRHQRASGGGRLRAGADRGHELHLYLRSGERQGAHPARDPVFRDVRPVGALSRRLAAQHQGEPGALAGLRSGQPGSAQQPGVPALRPEQGLEPDRRHRRQESAEGRGDAEAVRCGSQEIPGVPAGCLDGGAYGRPAPEHHRRAQRVRLHAADGWAAAGRLAAAAQHLLHHHGRYRGAQGRRQWHDPNLGRALRRIRLLSAQGQAGVPVEHGGSRAAEMGRAHRLAAGQAHGRVRLQI